MQLPYVKQLHDKTLVVRKHLQCFAGEQPIASVCDDIVPSPLPLGYRTSTKLCLNEDAFGRRKIGLYERRSKTVVDIPDCPVQHGDINRLIKRIFATPSPAAFVNHEKRGFQPGCLKFLTIRFCPSTGAFGLVISHTGVDAGSLKAWAEALKLPSASIYASQLSKKDEDRILSHASTHLAGPERFRYQIGGLEFLLTPEAFFQANFSLTDMFIRTITDFNLASRPQAGGLLDLYGGFGAYALNAAAKFKRLTVVDANVNAINAAQATADAMKLTHLTAVHATTEDFLNRLSPKDAAAVSHIIVNPPRSGLTPTVKARLNRKTFPKLEQVVYVSCDVTSLARDLAELSRQRSLHLSHATPFDMFPQTEHVEVVAKLVPPVSAVPKKQSQRP